MKKITTLFITLLFVSVLSAQSIQFQKTYGGPGTEYCWAVAQTSDGGYILTGETGSFGAGNNDAFLTKTDAFGTVQWTRVYGGSGYDWAYMVRQTSDGGFIVVGGTENAGNGLGDIWIFKTNSSGVVAWQRTCGGSGGDSGYDVVQTSDGGYIVAGFQNNPTAGNDNACLLKLDGSGNVQWIHSYSVGANDDYGYSVAQVAGGGYLLTGESFDGTSSVALVIKTDASGSLQWSNTYGGATDHWINSVLPLPSGDCIIAGTSSQISYLNIWLARINPNGVLVWSNSYAGTGSNSEVAYWVTSTADGGFAVCGRSNSFSVDYTAFLMKTDSTGAPEWSKLYGGSANDRANVVIESTSGGYALAANTLSFGNGESAYFIKTDSAGSSGCNESIPSFLMSPETTPMSTVTVIDSSLTNAASASIASTSPTFTETSLCFTVGEKELASAEDLISIYPNPAMEEFTISNSGFAIEGLEIYSALGEKKLSQKQAAYSQQKKINVDTHSWSDGVYMVVIKTLTGTVVKKLIKQ